MKLDLRAPLVYDQPADFPPELTEEDEFLFCFELNPEQGRSIEPDRDRLLGPLLCGGRAARFGSQSAGCSGVSLPVGQYLFVQRRAAHSGANAHEEWLDLAVEQQKDGLWERYKPENRLYVRYLYEDGLPVTQLFRPL